MVSGPYDFSGRTVLITGASRGIAAAIARGVARCGGRVVLHYSSAVDRALGKADAVEKLVDEIKALGTDSRTVDVDLATDGAGRRVGEMAIAAFGVVDSVVLSASLQIHRPLLLQEHADIDRQLRINIHANVELLQVLMPPMARAQFGRIVAIGSTQETAPSDELPIYAMCKAALRNLVENLALQVNGTGITVNNIAPGLVQTDRNAFRRADIEAWEQLARTANPVGRTGLPEDIVGPALLLLAGESSYLNGVTIHATGGSHLSHRSEGHIYPRLVLPSEANETIANREKEKSK